MCIIAGARIDIKIDPEIIKGLLDHAVVPIYYFLWRDAFFSGL